MNGLEVKVVGGVGLEIEPLLVTIIRQSEDDLYGDEESCHLFAYRGTKNVGEALADAIREYVSQSGEMRYDAIEGEMRPMDWFEMMAEREDYGEIFAKHGLTELRIPMGMTSFVFGNSDPLSDYLEAY